jgi:hypothetical protein
MHQKIETSSMIQWGAFSLSARKRRAHTETSTPFLRDLIIAYPQVV